MTRPSDDLTVPWSLAGAMVRVTPRTTRKRTHALEAPTSSRPGQARAATTPTANAGEHWSARPGAPTSVPPSSPRPGSTCTARWPTLRRRPASTRSRSCPTASSTHPPAPARSTSCRTRRPASRRSDHREHGQAVPVLVRPWPRRGRQGRCPNLGRAARSGRRHSWIGAWVSNARALTECYSTENEVVFTKIKLHHL